MGDKVIAILTEKDAFERLRLKTKPAGISWVLSFFLDRIYKKWYNKAVS